MTQAKLSIVSNLVPQEDEKPSGNLVRAAMTAQLTAHEEVLTAISDKELARVLLLKHLDATYALHDAEKARERLSRLGGIERLQIWQTTLIAALESPFIEHVVRSLIEVLLHGMRGRLANRSVFIDAMLFAIDREGISPPIVAGAISRIWGQRKMIPSQHDVLEACRSHREEVRRAAAIMKKAIALHANAQEVIAAAAKIRWRQASFDFAN